MKIRKKILFDYYAYIVYAEITLDKHWLDSYEKSRLFLRRVKLIDNKNINPVCHLPYIIIRTL